MNSKLASIISDVEWKFFQKDFHCYIFTWKNCLPPPIYKCSLFIHNYRGCCVANKIMLDGLNEVYEPRDCICLLLLRFLKHLHFYFKYNWEICDSYFLRKSTSLGYSYEEFCVRLILDTLDILLFKADRYSSPPLFFSFHSLVFLTSIMVTIYHFHSYSP